MDIHPAVRPHPGNRTKSLALGMTIGLLSASLILLTPPAQAAQQPAAPAAAGHARTAGMFDNLFGNFNNLFSNFFSNNWLGNLFNHSAPPSLQPATHTVIPSAPRVQQPSGLSSFNGFPFLSNGFFNLNNLAQPQTNPTPTSTNTGAQGGNFDTQTLNLISQYRQQNGLNPLTANSYFMQIALGHSQDMAARQSMDHNGFQQRFQAAGRNRCVENVAWNYNTPSSLFNAWRNSPEHNANMLDPAIQQAGVAIVNGYSTFFACSAN